MLRMARKHYRDLLIKHNEKQKLIVIWKAQVPVKLSKVICSKNFSIFNILQYFIPLKQRIIIKLMQFWSLDKLETTLNWNKLEWDLVPNDGMEGYLDEVHCNCRKSSMLSSWGGIKSTGYFTKAWMKDE